MAGVISIVPGRATGTIIVSDFANIAANATVTVNGKVLTNGVEWTNITSSNATATSIASAITTATANTKCTAAAVGATVTLNSNIVGSAGNVTLVTSDAVRLTTSGTTLTGGNSGIIGSSGSPAAIYESGCLAGADLCVLDFYDGTNSSGTLVLRLSCAASVPNYFYLGKGVVFKNGCFVDITVTDITKIPTLVTVSYTKI